MRTGTRWHAIHAVVAHSSITRGTCHEKNQQEGWIACHCVPLGRVVITRIPLRLNVHRPEVLMTCPKCGETRLIERVDRHRWFCAVCAHSWRIASRVDVDTGTEEEQRTSRSAYPN
jgi:ribosomal protein L37AE/L43A